jgi:hypothetical protein
METGGKAMIVRKPLYSKEEFRRRGQEIYQERIVPNLRAADKGLYVAIDIDSGAFEIDEDEVLACNRLEAKLPNSQTWVERVGFQASRHFGGLREKS